MKEGMLTSFLNKSATEAKLASEMQGMLISFLSESARRSK
jgi:hypothetical protein